jgi:hypothetical protein
MNVSSNSELISTSVFGVMVLSVLAINGMASAVVIGTVIAASVMTATYFLSDK